VNSGIGEDSVILGL